MEIHSCLEISQICLTAAEKQFISTHSHIEGATKLTEADKPKGVASEDL